MFEERTFHILVRQPDQWGVFLTNITLRLVSTNAKNRLLLDRQFIDTCARSLAFSLSEATVPVFQPQSHTFVQKVPSSTERVGVLASKVPGVSWSVVVADLQTKCWLSMDVVSAVSGILTGFKLRMGQWDKATFRMCAMCKVLDDMHIAQSVVFGDRFSVLGWALTPLQARASVVLYILDKARECGVLKDAREVRKLRKRMYQRDLTVEWLVTYLQLFAGDERHTIEMDESASDERDANDDLYVNPPIAPSIFHNVKWKSDEFLLGGVGLRFRDIVSFKGHPLQSYGRLLSGALRTAITFAYSEMPSLGFSSLEGVRDTLHAPCRLRVHLGKTLFCEKDMAGMFWEIPIDQIFSFLEWVTEKLPPNNALNP